MTQHNLDPCDRLECVEESGGNESHDLLEAIEGQLSSRKIRLPNSLVAALFIQHHRSRPGLLFSVLQHIMVAPMLKMLPPTLPDLLRLNVLLIMANVAPPKMPLL